MTQAEPQPAALRLGAIRLGIGLAQGLALYGLTESRDELLSPVYAALIMVAVFVPVVALGALGTVRSRTFWIWLAAATLTVAVVGAYDGYLDWFRADKWPRFPVFAFSAAGLFVAHHLIVAADAERRWTASYERYFDEGWKDGVRIVLAAAFVGAFWLLLFLGAALFKLIGLDFIETLIRKPWFGWPATTAFFALAVHLTDTRAALVRGARTLALTLLSWLLPLMTLIGAGFLVALALTGLGPLWATGRASGMLLAATAALIVLVNATYQDGERDGYPPRVLKWAARIAAVLLAPLILVAVYGVGLRIGQYGLTPARIYSVACLAVAAVYAGGYAWASLTRSAWMRRLERVNIVAAHLVVAVLLALFTPLADPARIAVGDQVARLKDGRTGPEAFDYAFLRFHAGRWGEAELKKLAGAKPGPIRERAVQALAMEHPYSRQRPVVASDRAELIKPAGGPLPADFLKQVWPTDEDPALGCRPGCVALTRDLDGDASPEVMVFGNHVRTVFSRKSGSWRTIGDLMGPRCDDEMEALRAGRFQIVPARGSEVLVDGHRLTFGTGPRCPGAEGVEVIDAALIRPVPPPPEAKRPRP